MNRGSLGPRHRIEEHQIASMRPRFMNRGSAVRHPPARTMLGDRFNEAPIHESGKLPAASELIR